MSISIFLAIPLLLISYYFLSREGRTREERMRGRNRLQLINRLGFFDEPNQSDQNDFKTSANRHL